MLDSHLMPLDSPVDTEMDDAATMTTRMLICTQATVSAPNTLARPELICSVPSPTETAMPKTVPMIDRASISFPGHE